MEWATLSWNCDPQKSSLQHPNKTVGHVPSHMPLPSAVVVAVVVDANVDDWFGWPEPSEHDRRPIAAAGLRELTALPEVGAGAEVGDKPAIARCNRCTAAVAGRASGRSGDGYCCAGVANFVAD